jgi:hypothetical protein
VAAPVRGRTPPSARRCARRRKEARAAYDAGPVADAGMAVPSSVTVATSGALSRDLGAAAAGGVGDDVRGVPELAARCGTRGENIFWPRRRRIRPRGLVHVGRQRRSASVATQRSGPAGTGSGVGREAVSLGRLCMERAGAGALRDLAGGPDRCRRVGPHCFGGLAW